MNTVSKIGSALSDDNRLRVVMFLGGGELCLCQIIEMLALAPSTVSKHMSVLHEAGLVETRKEGRWIFYRLAGQGTPACAARALAWVKDSLRTDARIRQDLARLRAVRKMSRESLCEHYKS